MQKLSKRLGQRIKWALLIHICSLGTSLQLTLEVHNSHEQRYRQPKKVIFIPLAGLRAYIHYLHSCSNINDQHLNKKDVLCSLNRASHFTKAMPLISFKKQTKKENLGISLSKSDGIIHLGHSSVKPLINCTSVF